MIRLDKTDELYPIASEGNKQLKLVHSQKDLLRVISFLRDNKLDLYSKAYTWSSDNFDFEDLSEDRLMFTYGCWPICGRCTKMWCRNVHKNFYIAEKR
ncbi:hypothetical protein D3C81_11750 [compost metagenome]